jgi:hypothetical protein
MRNIFLETASTVSYKNLNSNSLKKAKPPIHIAFNLALNPNLGTSFAGTFLF